MEEWNTGILGIKAENNPFKLNKKPPFLKLRSVQAHPSFHYSIIPIMAKPLSFFSIPLSYEAGNCNSSYL
jgi:hypothetical protein